MNEKIKVLMVDDEDKFRETTRKILNRRGFETLIAADGREAIARLAENPSVVVLDVKMPGMEGHQVLSEIKKRNPQIPVIMLTGHGARPSAREALDQGAHDYLTKPCDIDLLTAKIMDAAKSQVSGRFADEKKVGDVMIPLSQYTTVKEADSVRIAVQILRDTYTSRISTSRLMETGHRSVLVFNDAGQMTGVLSIVDLLSAMMPAYLSAPRPSMADSIRHSSMFWRGLFTRAVKEIGDRPVAHLMQPAPQTIDAQANLMEAAHTMLALGARRLVVRRAGRMAGIVREQELFFEIENILRE
jgi:CheY-like chemotaxis protein